MNKVDLNILSDALSEAVLMVAYLRVQEHEEVTFVIGKCREAPKRNITACG